MGVVLDLYAKFTEVFNVWTYSFLERRKIGLKELRVSVDDKEWAFIEKAKAVVPKEWAILSNFFYGFRI
jgi:hypothetical protein